MLERIEQYYDQVPRAAARIELIGPFILFVKQGGGWPYYARPTLGARTFAADDVLGRLAFDAPGTAIGEVGTAGLAAAQPDSVEFDRERLRRGLTVTAAAFNADGDPVASGSHQPLQGLTKIVGVGTLPAFRRRGIAAALTALLVDDALRRVETVFLSANDAVVARVYERIGFRRLATACIAEPA